MIADVLGYTGIAFLVLYLVLIMVVGFMTDRWNAEILKNRGPDSPARANRPQGQREEKAKAVPVKREH